MTKPRIAHFLLHYLPSIGGAEISEHNYLRMLVNDYDIDVFCFLNSDGKKFIESKIEFIDGVRVIQSAFSIEQALRKYILEEKPSLIFTQLVGSDLVADICLKNNIPVILKIHGLYEDICKNYLSNSCPYSDLETCPFEKGCSNSLFLQLKEGTYRKCSKVILNSEYSQKVFSRFFPSIQTEVIYPHFNSDLFFRANNFSAQKKVLAVNSMPFKGRNTVAALAKLNPDIEFVYLDCKEKDREFLNQFPNIKQRGRISRQEMSELYQQVNVVLCPTYMLETFGGVVSEAILSGVPVLCSNKGNLKNLVQEGKNGFFIEPNNVKECNEKLHLALEMQLDYSCAEKIKKQINPKINIKKLKKIIDNLIPREIKDNVSEINSREQRQKIIKELKRGDKKTILFLAQMWNPPLGGGEFYILNNFKNLSSDYVCIGAGYKHPDTNLNFTQNKYFEWHGIPSFQLIIHNQKDIHDFIEDVRPDLVLTQSYDALVIIRTGKSLGAKTIYGTHFWRNICAVQDQFFKMLERPLSTVQLLPQNQIVFHEADDVYVNSVFMQKAVERYVGKKIEKVINPIVDLERIFAQEKKPEFVTIINADVGKGGEIFARIAKSLPNIPFLCVGLGSEISEENKRVNAIIKSIKNVEVIEKSDDIKEIYSKTKILLVPSLVDETFSMVALEAFFNGIPVIASSVGNLRFLVEDGGILLEPLDIDAWVSATNELYSNEKVYQNMSELALKTSKKYDPLIELDKFENMIKIVLGDLN